MAWKVLTFGFAAFAFFAVVTPEPAQAQDAVEAAGDETLAPTRYPMLDYPMRAAKKGLQGTCTTQFDLGADGKPRLTAVACTSDLFCAYARKAMAKARFKPISRNGKIVIVRNLTYPLEWTIDGLGDDFRSQELKLCSEAKPSKTDAAPAPSVQPKPVS